MVIANTFKIVGVVASMLPVHAAKTKMSVHAVRIQMLGANSYS